MGVAVMKRASLFVLWLVFLLHPMVAYGYQASINVPNGTGLQVRTATNNALQAITTQQSGASAPSPSYAYQAWVDTSTSPAVYKIRNGSNTAWISIGTLNSTSNLFFGGNVDTVDGFHATQTPTIGQIPVVTSLGDIAIPGGVKAISSGSNHAYLTVASPAGQGYIYNTYQAGLIVPDSSAGDTILRTTNKNVRITTNDGVSSAVTVNTLGYLLVGTPTGYAGRFQVENNGATNGGFRVYPNYDATNGVILESTNASGTIKPLSYNGSVHRFYQGNIVVGSGSDDGVTKLQVAGNVTATGTITGTINTSNLTGTLSTDRFPAGSVIGYYETKSFNIINVTGAIPYDNTIPQQTEGYEVFTLSYTPKKANSLLRIEFFGSGEFNNGSQLISALFVDSGSNALAAAVGSYGSDNWTGIAKLDHTVSAINTTARTYKIRCGVNSGTFHINGQAGGSVMFGGVGYAKMSITEIAQ